MISLAMDLNWAEFPLNLTPFIGAMMIVMWLMARLRKRGRPHGPLPTAGEQLEKVRQVRGIRGNLEDVMVEVEQLSKRFSAQLEAKSIQLNKLIEHADQRIALLKQLESHQQTPPVSPAPSAAPVTTEPENETAQSVYRLADAGNNPIEIARITGEHVGKVELILALRQG